MQCGNCKEEIPDESQQCPFCHVFIKNLKLETNAEPIHVCILMLETGEEFELSGRNQITIGRVDLGANPMIDLGPYDKGPFISRLQGMFDWEGETLYYTDKGKNQILLNNKKLETNKKTKLQNNDKLKFGEINARIVFK